MEERIAELNRQSMEARSKLLQLIEQQKLVGLNLSSSPASPVQSPLRAWAGGSPIPDFQIETFVPLNFESSYRLVLCSSTPNLVPEETAWVGETEIVGESCLLFCSQSLASRATPFK